MRLLLIIIIVLFETVLFAQTKELSIIIQPGFYYSKMRGNDEGTFRKNNELDYITNFGLRYKWGRNSLAMAYAGFPITMHQNLAMGDSHGAMGARRFESLPVYFGYEAFYIFNKRVAIDMQIGNYFLIGSYTGPSGIGLGTGLNNGTIPVDATWSYTTHYKAGFRNVPFLGVEFRNVQLKKLDLSFGYRRFIGVQQLGETRIEYKPANEPVRNYSLESRGTGNLLFVSLSIRVWRKVKEHKMITSPFDYPSKTDKN